MAILEKEKLEQHLNEYYEEHFGRQDTDIWYEQPAVNVWVFGRGGKIITLKVHLLTGVVTEKSEG